MIRQRRMAILAGKINPAAFHLDGNNVGRPTPMRAPGLRIKINAAHFRKI
jgi:hypothetical protein